MPSVSVPGCTLHFDIVDLTPPWRRSKECILFHHGLGATSGSWAAWLPALADAYRIVTFDMRGHGRSQPLDQASPPSFERLVEDLFAVADAAGGERFHLVGESIGGTIALAAAIARGSRILTLTVSNGAHVGGSIRSIDDWRQIMQAGGMAGWSRHMMRLRFFEDAIDEEMWRWYEREQASASPEFVLRAVELLASVDLSPGLERLRMPVLLLHGDSSPFIPVPVLADLKSRLPDARLQVVAHARHGLPFSHARQCAQLLRGFLEETQARRAG
jgi:pimeloyl-ACP methyl ester carboxylesterase